MELLREYKGANRFNIVESELFVLINNDNHSNIKKIQEHNGIIVWQRDIEKAYDFVVLDNKIFATTGKDPQKTLVLSCTSGEVLDDKFKAVLHLPLFSKSNERFICYATYFEKNVDLRFTKDLMEIEVVNPKKVKVSKRIDEDYFLCIEKDTIQVHDYKTSNSIWMQNLSEVVSNIYASSLKVKPKVYQIELVHNTIIMGVSDLGNNDAYIFGMSLESGHIKWHHRAYSNFELYKGKLYNIEFYGQYRVLNAETGEVEQEVDLKHEFERMNINCEHRFNVTDTHIYFKYAIKGKFGILNTRTLTIEEVQQLPEGNTMSTEEYPIPVDNRLYVRSAPQNNLFVYERDK